MLALPTLSLPCASPQSPSTTFRHSIPLGVTSWSCDLPTSQSQEHSAPSAPCVVGEASTRANPLPQTQIRRRTSSIRSPLVATRFSALPACLDMKGKLSCRLSLPTAGKTTLRHLSEPLPTIVHCLSSRSPTITRIAILRSCLTCAPHPRLPSLSPPTQITRLLLHPPSAISPQSHLVAGHRLNSLLAARMTTTISPTLPHPTPSSTVPSPECQLMQIHPVNLPVSLQAHIAIRRNHRLSEYLQSLKDTLPINRTTIVHVAMLDTAPLNTKPPDEKFTTTGAFQHCIGAICILITVARKPPQAACTALHSKLETRVNDAKHPTPCTGCVNQRLRDVSPCLGEARTLDCARLRTPRIAREARHCATSPCFKAPAPTRGRRRHCPHREARLQPGRGMSETPTSRHSSTSAAS